MARRPAFTLIELLVVIAIIGVIAVLIMVRMGNARGKAVVSIAKSDVSEVGKSIELFRKNEGVIEGSIILNTSATADTLTDSPADGIPAYGGTDLRVLFTGTPRTSTPFEYGIKISNVAAKNMIYTYKTNKTKATRAPEPACYYFSVSGLNKHWADSKPIFSVVNGATEESTEIPPLPSVTSACSQ